MCPRVLGRKSENLCMLAGSQLTLQSADNMHRVDRYLPSPMGHLDGLFLGISLCLDEVVMATYY